MIKKSGNHCKNEISLKKKNEISESHIQKREKTMTEKLWIKKSLGLKTTG